MDVEEHEVSSFVMGYHEYSNTWTAIVGEVLQCRMESMELNIDKYAVVVMNKGRVYLMKGKLRKFTKTVFFFLSVDVTNSAEVTVNGKAVNKGGGMGMEVICTISFIR